MINDRFTTLADAEIGTSLSRPVLVSSISESVAKNGKTFVRMTIKDGVTEQTATMFDTSVASLELKGITKETIADVILNVNEYQG
ncbi:MAG: metal-dependent phosphohydrolase, partial [Oscillospiraceae bacterium]|nr:metal-dependent phosphohydrolase [Oscillospiraceae bacterium]